MEKRKTKFWMCTTERVEHWDGVYWLIWLAFSINFLTETGGIRTLRKGTLTLQELCKFCNELSLGYTHIGRKACAKTTNTHTYHNNIGSSTHVDRLQRL